MTHVLFIINLPRTELSTTKNNSSFVGFQGGSWKSSHIDDIQQPSSEQLTLDEARSAPINELFYNMQFVSKKQETASEESNVHDEVTSEPLTGGTHVEDDDIQIMDLEDTMETEEDTIEDTIEQMEEDGVHTMYQLSVNEEVVSVIITCMIHNNYTIIFVFRILHQWKCHLSNTTNLNVTDCTIVYKQLLPRQQEVMTRKKNGLHKE